jgi:serine/threonine protein kinase
MIVEDQLIGARFEKCAVERLIGRGGYGLTFLAFDDELREHRVIKVSLAWGDDHGTRDRHQKSFIEEGLIISRLKHPQIVTLRAQGEKDGRRYMILDYIHGHSIKSILDIVEKRKQDLGCAWSDLLDPAAATALLLSTLYPLSYAHRANVHLPDREIFGVAHRDISPGNLILGLKGNEKGNVILIDFGTAKTDLSDNFTVNHNLVGTIPYMGKARLQKAATPEQAGEYQAYWRSFRETQHDIHSLGVLYYQLLTGRLPFPGESTPQIIVKVLDPDTYTAIHVEMARDLPGAAGIMEKCLVYHDFSLPYHEQAYQYPDASAMLPDVEAAFRAFAPGRTVREVLVELGEKLSQPEKLGASVYVSRRTPDSTYVAVALPQPMYYPIASRHRGPVPLLAAGAVLTALAVAGAWWLRGGRPDALPSRPPAVSAPAPAPRADVPAVDNLERLEPLAARTPPSGAKAHASAKKTGDRIEAPAGPVSPSQPAAAASTVVKTGARELDKDAFVELQSLVREDDPSAYDRLTEWLTRYPASPDLIFLKCQVVLRRNPASREVRADLASLQEAHPDFIHPLLFHENAMYLLWQADAAQFESQKTPANRINLLKSANAYLAEFQPNPAYAQKIRGIKEKLPK